MNHLGCALSTEDLDDSSLKVILTLFQVIVLSCDGYCKVLPLAIVRRDVETFIFDSVRTEKF